MLVTLIVLLVAMLSGGVPWQPAAAAGNAATVPTITLQDPSSLTLALIGGGMLAVYFALSRTIRARRPTLRARYVGNESTGIADERAADMQRETRDAA